MGPKGERGQPGSIVWNGIKVSDDFLVHSIEDATFFDHRSRARKANREEVKNFLEKIFFHPWKQKLFKVHRDHQDQKVK